MSVAGARILLVEDDRDLSEFLRHLFEQEKYEVILSVDGEDALHQARTIRPDVILLDVLLPKMHGFEVCQCLRQDPSTCLIPIIMVTSLTSIKDRLTGFKLGADEYVSKPFEPIELLARMERLIERTRQNIAANPLTGLPGSVSLEDEIKQMLKKEEKFSVGYGDANHLSDFNEDYGFEQGDGVIRLLGTIMRSAVVELGNRNDIAVHLGSDDFAFVSTPARAEVVGSRILENVEFLIPMQYDEVSRERGYYLSKDNEGRELRKPFLTFSIGVLNISPNQFTHHAQVLDQVRHVLKEAKKIGGNQLVKMP